VSIKLQDSDTKYIELPPKRWVILFYFYFILNFFDCFAVFLHVSVDVSVQLTTPYLFPFYRWAAFRQVVDDTDKSVRATLSGDQNVQFRAIVTIELYMDNWLPCSSLRVFVAYLYSVYTK